MRSIALKTLLVLLAVIAHPAWAGEECSLSTLYGDFIETGTGVPSEGSPPRIVVGVETFDGMGGLSGKETRTTGGEISRVTYDGTYTLDADCTGTVTVGAAHWDLVVTKDGREGVLIRTDPGTMFIRNFKK